MGFALLFNNFGFRTSNRVLATFMLTNAILLLSIFLGSNFNFLQTKVPLLGFIIWISYILLPILLYFYIRSLCEPKFQFRTKYFFHFTSYIFIIALHIIANYVITNHQVYNELVNRIYWVLLHITMATYISLSLLKLYQYRKNTKSIESNLHKIDLLWITIILFSFILMWLADFMNYILPNFFKVPSNISYGLFIFSISINFSFCIIMFYISLSLSQRLSGIKELPKYNSSKLQHGDYLKILNQLKNHLEKEQLHLIQSITIKEFSEAVNLTPKQISQAINLCLNQNFNDFINSYRIETSKKLIQADPLNKKTILEILFNSGFKSKSVFNKVFKETTGITPKQYREQLVSKS
jgi:AraC-like DNA-binding protein